MRTAGRWKQHHLVACIALLVSLGRGTSGQDPAAAAGAATVNVTTSPELAAALCDSSARRIVLVPAPGKTDADLTVTPEEWPPDSRVCTIDRNVTITSDPPHARMEWSYIQGRCRMGAGVHVRFQDLILSGTRSSSGFNLDLFLRSDAAVVELVDVVRDRRACSPDWVNPTNLTTLPRPSDFPGAQTVALPSSFCVRTTCYQSSAVVFQDVVIASTIPPDTPDAGGGYVIVNANATRVCRAFVTRECIQRQGTDSCILELLQRQLRAEKGGDGGGAVPVAAIVVPVVLGSAALAVCAAALLARRNRRRRRRSDAGDLALFGGGGGSGGEGDLLQRDAPEEAWKRGLTIPHASEGWQLIAKRTGVELASKGGAGAPLSLGVLLGTGSFGKVYKGRWLERDVAVKVVLHSRLTAQHVARECEIIMGLHHPNIVRAFQFLTWYQAATPPQAVADSQSPSNTGVPQDLPSDPGDGVAHEAPTGDSRPDSWSEGALDAQTWIVFEFCDEGNCYDASRRGMLTQFEGRPTLLPLLCRLLEVAAGMCHLHDQNIVHGDLKSSNVLLASHPGAPFGTVAKVSDFGMSRTLAEGHTHRSTRTMGTVTHMSPEQLRSGKMSMAGDVYAFGITAWELLTGRTAFAGMHYGQIVERVVLRQERPAMPEDAPDDYRLLVEACWADDARGRPTFEAVRQCILLMMEPRVGEAAAAGDAALLEAATASSSHGSRGDQATASSSGGCVAPAGGSFSALRMRTPTPGALHPSGSNLGSGAQQLSSGSGSQNTAAAAVSTSGMVAWPATPGMNCSEPRDLV